ncbi:unnamed protein product [Tetraodon nigroviridis]|uniref:Chromosome 1 SCAF14716, whole genome shotgun sequence n=1 Tax=Tetraodon nigroviridis TaxID=99883 RepID=Q4S7A7_TETNG|nr:unnamed protein product [Tetraodon nigroviridis]
MSENSGVITSSTLAPLRDSLRSFPRKAAFTTPQTGRACCPSQSASTPAARPAPGGFPPFATGTTPTGHYRHSNPRPGEICCQLHTDLDKGDSAVKYTLSGDGAGSIFTIDQTTGDIHALRSLDREEKPYYTLRAQAVDINTNRPLEPESEFVIKVQDINDNEPKFLEGPYRASVPEMSPVGTYVTQVTATDADDPTYGNSARVVYSILHGQPYFSVDPKTGVIKTALPNMDREVKEQYQVLIQAKDMGGQLGGLAGTTTVNITLSDVNDNPPRFSKSFFHLRVPESSAVGSAVGRIKAHDLDIGRNAEVEYTIVPGDGGNMFDITTNDSHSRGHHYPQKGMEFQ